MGVEERAAWERLPDTRTIPACCCRVRFLVMAGAQCLLSGNPPYKRVCRRFHKTSRRSISLSFLLSHSLFFHVTPSYFVLLCFSFSLSHFRSSPFLLHPLSPRFLPYRSFSNARLADARLLKTSTCFWQSTYTHRWHDDGSMISTFLFAF